MDVSISTASILKHWSLVMLGDVQLKEGRFNLSKEGRLGVSTFKHERHALTLRLQ